MAKVLLSEDTWAHTLKLMKCFTILSVQVWRWQRTGVLRPKPKPVNFLFGEPTPPHSHPDIKVKHIKIYFTSFQIITNIALEGIVLKHHSQPDSLLPPVTEPDPHNLLVQAQLLC